MRLGACMTTGAASQMPPQGKEQGVAEYDRRARNRR